MKWPGGSPDAILDSVYQVRQGNVRPRRVDGEWFRHDLRMPESHYFFWISVIPELNSKDPEVLAGAWDAFMDSPAAEPYRVWKPKRRGSAAGRGIIVK